MKGFGTVNPYNIHALHDQTINAVGSTCGGSNAPNSYHGQSGHAMNRTDPEGCIKGAPVWLAAIAHVEAAEMVCDVCSADSWK